MTSILVANRGEIALRVFRTARRMGMRTVAVYSDPDVDAPHVRGADEAVHIGGVDAYLHRDRIVEAALSAGAQLVHPGYGFLSEDDRFAQDCADAGLTFVGPPAEVLRRVGDKEAAKQLAMSAKVPVLPSEGYPLIVKPAAGGGGKGMTIVRSPEELPGALDSARRIAAAAFDDDRLILERYLEHPRHVEVQVFADGHGRVIHLGERDCSLQRRHQKILEESPAPNLDFDMRATLHRSAVDFARAAGYVGAGTCEFLIGPDGDVGFIEMNARLQVEHPVTELVTGLDLVELQLRVASGEALPLTQEDVRCDGHAIEVRVYAEAPEEGFLPQAGRIRHVRWPDDVRVDAGVEEGTDVSTHYDPLLAKIVVAANDRAEALGSLEGALARTEVLGVRTNLTFLAAVVGQPVVRSGSVRTDWLDASPVPVGDGAASDTAVSIAAAAEVERLAVESADPWEGLRGWRPGGRRRTHVVLRPEDAERDVVVEGVGPFIVRGDTIEHADRCHAWVTDGVTAAAAHGDDLWYVWVDGRQHEIPVGPALRRLSFGAARLDSPLPGRIVGVRVASGETVEEGDELVVVEAMKMEHAIRAPTAGTVRAILCREGEQVERGQALVDFEASV